MDSVIDSKTILSIAKWLGSGSFLLSAILMLAIAVLKRLFSKRKDRTWALREKWQPILIESLHQPPTQLPTLAKRDILEFLILWNYLQESIRDDSKDNLNVVARRLNLDLWAIRTLDKHNFRNRLMAIQTLGWMREKMVWDELLEIMKKGAPVSSLSAARALVRIDGKAIMDEFVHQIAERNDWSFSVVGKILREAGADTISSPLVNIATVSDEESVLKLLRYFELAHQNIKAPAIKNFLATSENANVIISSLRALQSPVDLPRVRELLTHENWTIRTQAARCLGRIGTKDDEKALAHAAGDQEWWVRYRAAQALANLPSTTIARLRELSMAHYNPYASDVIDKVISEQQIVY